MSASCSVNQRCSSTGRACLSDDRACQSAAVDQGLEILCEEAHDGAVEYIYCPPGAAQRDSGVVWLLLAVAFVIAIAGALVGYFVLRRPAQSSVLGPQSSGGREKRDGSDAMPD